jgi:hypothetical protein
MVNDNDMVLFPQEDDSSPVQTKKKARLSASLHSEFVAPLSFLVDAVTEPDRFVDKDGTLFGLTREAFVRPVYVGRPIESHDWCDGRQIQMQRREHGKQQATPHFTRLIGNWASPPSLPTLSLI